MFIFDLYRNLTDKENGILKQCILELSAFQGFFYIFVC